MPLESRKLTPKNIFIEKSILNTALVKRIKNKYPKIQPQVISSYSQHLKNKEYTIGDFNNRLDNLFLIKGNFKILKKCPCSYKSVSCGYHVVNLGMGCAFECAYCCLQEFTHPSGIFIPANIEDFFNDFETYKKDIRIGSGELSDSLVFDPITEFSTLIVNFFKKYPKSTFEFKTKSTNIEQLTSVTPAGNIVVAWSVNPQNIIDRIEFYTASLTDRIEAAVKCAGAGYKIAFHFDPIIHYPNWKKEYLQLVDLIFEKINPKQIAWISLGTLRVTPSLKKTIENRFPENTLLDEELTIGYDKKLRYSDSLRIDMYKTVLNRIRHHSKSIYTYLCMEEKSCVQNLSAML